MFQCLFRFYFVVLYLQSLRPGLAQTLEELWRSLQCGGTITAPNANNHFIGGRLSKGDRRGRREDGNTRDWHTPSNDNGEVQRKVSRGPDDSDSQHGAKCHLPGCRGEVFHLSSFNLSFGWCKFSHSKTVVPLCGWLMDFRQQQGQGLSFETRKWREGCWIPTWICKELGCLVLVLFS